MSPSTQRRTGAVLAAVAALIHFAELGEYLEEELYVGVLFLVGGAALAYTAVKLWRNDDGGAWMVGAVVCAGMVVGLLLSRTVGLPDFKEDEWEISAVLSLLLELGFLGLAAVVSRHRLLRGSLTSG